ncbi:MAG TPA: hypothetical protein PLZ84_09035, partial [Clostridia bacterium]|nr:hypothetical protein [Clostridia bacterium]
MEYPKMIIFDYGHTLLYEPGFDGARGMQAVLENAVSNRSNKTVEELVEFSNRLFDELLGKARKCGIEVHNFNFQRLLY